MRKPSAKNFPRSQRNFRRLGWAAAALCVAVWALPSLAYGQAATLLARVSRCYAGGDLGCVLTLLEGASLPAADQSPADGAECLRMLAFSAARLDRHDLARRSFAAWLAQPGEHRLERATTLPAIYQDYAAALLDTHAKDLDLQPSLGPRPTLSAPATTPADLPRFAPPQRAARDTARDFALLVAADISTAPGYAPDSLLEMLGASIGLEADLSPRWRLGLRAGGLRYAGPHAAIYGGTPTYLPYGLARLGTALWVDSGQSAEVLLGVGGGARVRDGDSDAVLIVAPALRYTWRPSGGSSLIAVFAEISGGVVASSGADALLNCALGVSLKPPRSAVGGP